MNLSEEQLAIICDNLAKKIVRKIACDRLYNIKNVREMLIEELAQYINKD